MAGHGGRPAGLEGQGQTERDFFIILWRLAGAALLALRAKAKQRDFFYYKMAGRGGCPAALEGQGQVGRGNLGRFRF